MLISTVPLFFLLLLLAVSFVLQTENAASGRSSQHASEMLALAARANTSIEDAGRGIAAYERTHVSSDLDAYRLAQTDVPQALRALRQGASGKAETAAARRFAASLEAGMVVLRTYLTEVRAGRIVAAHALAQSAGVRKLSLEIAASLAAFDQLELLTIAAQASRLQGQTGFFGVLLVTLSLIGAAVTIITSTRFGMQTTRRIARLAENARRLAAGEATEPIGGNDEIAELDRVYQEMTRRIQQEHDIATILQRALLPQDFPSFPGLRLDAAYVPAGAGARVGGDWYDVFELDERTVGISVGDVAGHGVRAAAIMDAARQAIRTVAQLDREPAAVLRNVNRVLYRNEAAPLVTAVFATLDLRDGTLRYAFAGHPAPIVVTSSSVEELAQGQGLVLGVSLDAEYETLERRLEVGSALVFYTDGVVETRRDYDAGLHELLESVEAEFRNASHNIAQAIVDRIFRANSPRDDAAVLFLGVTALGDAAVQRNARTWTVDARRAQSARLVKRAVLWHLGTMTGRTMDLSAVELIVTELIGNVAKHTPGVADVSLDWDGRRAIFRISDRGPRFSPDRIAAADVMAEGGRGLFLASALARDLSVDWKGDGNCVSVVLPIDLSSGGEAATA